jgi:hypothetical protein
MAQNKNLDKKQENNPVTSFMWLDWGHNEVPESEAIYGFGIRADGSRFVMEPRIQQKKAQENMTSEIVKRAVTQKQKIALVAPMWMRKNAKQGLEWHRQGKSGDGVTPKTLAEARNMAAGKVSHDKAMRMAAWFARHMTDLSAPSAKVGAVGYPSPGVVAHALWGGGSRAESRRAERWAKANSTDE